MKKSEKKYNIPTIISYLGLLPFIFSGISIWFFLDPWKSFIFLALINYTLIILTFVGAVHFGLAMYLNNNQTRWYIWSVLPAIFVWISVMCGIGYDILILFFIIGFLLTFMIDKLSYKLQRVPLWYLKLREKLTFTVILSLFSVYIYLIFNHF